MNEPRYAHECVTHTRVGPVAFSHPGKGEVPPMGHREVQYQWRHVPSGICGQRIMTMPRPSQLCALIEKWNRQCPGSWEYGPVSID